MCYLPQLPDRGIYSEIGIWNHEVHEVLRRKQHVTEKIVGDLL